MSVLSLLVVLNGRLPEFERTGGKCVTIIRSRDGRKNSGMRKCLFRKEFRRGFLASKMAPCVSPNAVRRRRYDGIFGSQPELSVRTEDKVERRLSSVEAGPTKYAVSPQCEVGPEEC
jgi:hypothetical protein